MYIDEMGPEREREETNMKRKETKTKGRKRNTYKADGRDLGMCPGCGSAG
jgi:hypothetical protein